MILYGNSQVQRREMYRQMRLRAKILLALCTGACFLPAISQGPARRLQHHLSLHHPARIPLLRTLFPGSWGRTPEGTAVLLEFESEVLLPAFPSQDKLEAEQKIRSTRKRCATQFTVPR